MSAPRNPDRLIHAFLMEGATELADEVYDDVRDRIEQTRQRAVIGSWREPDVNRYIKIALSAAAVLAIAVVGFGQLAGGAGSPEPSGSPGPSATPTPTASPSASGSAPALTETFTSELHGITMSYPNGWVPRPATEPWTTSGVDFMSTSGDIVHDPAHEGDLWIVAASQPIGDATPDAWVAERLAFDDGCGTSEPIEVDGATGQVGADGCTRAAVTADGLGYFFWLYTGGGDPSLFAPFDSAWFEEFLATVQLEPAGAALTQTFTSDRHGFTISYPTGWASKPATEPWTTSVPDYIQNTGDVFYDPDRGEGDLWIAVASQPIGDPAPDGWAAETIAVDDGCGTTEPMTVDGAAGLIGTGNCTRFAVATGGRGYFIWLYTGGNDPSLATTYDRAWFEEVLAAVQLQPEDAT